MTESWLPIPGFEGRYEISDQGRVRSLFDANKHMRKWREVPLILRQSLNGRGYCRVWLFSAASKRQCLVHRLVLLAFVGPCPPNLEAGHRDGEKINNDLSNLRWITRFENAAEREAHRLARGAHHPSRKVTAAIAAAVTAALRETTGRAAAERFGLSEATVSQIKTGKYEAAPQ